MSTWQQWWTNHLKRLSLCSRTLKLLVNLLYHHPIISAPCSSIICRKFIHDFVKTYTVIQWKDCIHHLRNIFFSFIKSCTLNPKHSLLPCIFRRWICSMEIANRPLFASFIFVKWPQECHRTSLHFQWLYTSETSRHLRYNVSHIFKLHWCLGYDLLKLRSGTDDGSFHKRKGHCFHCGDSLAPTASSLPDDY